MMIMSATVPPTASQTCSSWDASKELELVRCKEDLQGLDVEVFRTSARIAKVTSQEECVGYWAGLPVPRSSLGGGRTLLNLAVQPPSSGNHSFHGLGSNSCHPYLKGLQYIRSPRGCLPHSKCLKVSSCLLSIPVMWYTGGERGPERIEHEALHTGVRWHADD